MSGRLWPSSLWKISVVFMATATVMSAAACGSYGADDDGQTVEVSLKDFDLTLSPGSIPSGQVRFEASNDGPSTHEFEVFSGAGDFDLASLPIEDGVADTEGLTLVDEVEDVTPGSSRELSVDLEPGTYAVICNLPDHFVQGMHATLTVG